MARNTRPDSPIDLEQLERQQQRRTDDEDEGLSPDDMNPQRILDDTSIDPSDTLPSERPTDRDSPEARGSSRVDDEVRGEKRKQQYEGGADLVSEID